MVDGNGKRSALIVNGDGLLGIEASLHKSRYIIKCGLDYKNDTSFISSILQVY